MNALLKYIYQDTDGHKMHNIERNDKNALRNLFMGSAEYKEAVELIKNTRFVRIFLEKIINVN